MADRCAALIGCILLCLGIGSAAAQDQASRFAGRYRGTFTCVSTDPNFSSGEGRVALLIQPNGKLKANISNSNSQGSAEGTISEDGETVYIVDFGTQAFVVKGILTKNAAGHLKGNLNQYFGKDRIVAIIKFDLPPDGE